MVYLWLSSVWTASPCGEVETLAAQGHALALQADQIHLDAMRHGIVGRVMGKAVQIEIGAQFAIGARQQILVEQGGDAGGIVIGGMQPHRVLHQIHADQQARRRSARRACAAAAPWRRRA